MRRSQLHLSQGGVAKDRLTHTQDAGEQSTGRRGMNTLISDTTELSLRKQSIQGPEKAIHTAFLY